MPTFRSGAEFAKQVERMNRDIDRQRITRLQALRAQQIATQEASRDLGGDPKFSGWKPELVTQTKAIRGGATIMMPTRSSAGPWTVAEYGRGNTNVNAFSGPGANRRTGMTRRNKSGGLRNVAVFRGGSKWSGYTKGKHTASRVQSRLDADALKIAAVDLRRVTRKHFDVR